MRKFLFLLFVIVLAVATQAQISFSSSMQKEDIVLYPNPAKSEGLLNIKSETGFIPQSAQLFNSAGKPLDLFFPTTFTSQSVMALPKLPPGIYLLSFLNKEKKRESKKVVVTY